MRSKGNSSLHRPIALTIAGFDGTGGAGVVADVKTFTALGCYGLAVVTAITVQNTVAVRTVTPLTATLIIEQLETLYEDINIDAVKIGMLANSEIALAVANYLAQKQPRFIVLDTLLDSSSGFPLLTPEARKIVCEKLFPLATIITPNLAEATALTGQSVNDIETMRRAAQQLHAMGSSAVLIKGGHLQTEAIDLFYQDGDCQTFQAARIENAAAHGTGCALSAAIAALLGQGNTLKEAVSLAKQFVTRALIRSERIGQGMPLLDHLGANDFI
ncbi:MAG: bifunctional hydroxymethylpyrimidine kinase/phosphomethylpyrimidine kinase [Acidobacteriota bacterium]